MNSNIFFQPFVGKDYANGGIFGKRIMILGESQQRVKELKDGMFREYTLTVRPSRDFLQ